ncbi:hypothetical protein [Streptomyces sp. NPDC056387]|uniref:hypothetical protein n=1 Tax=Streptomyces sp. NPDC056387 TaxID=3345803 RepID=UPI0035D7C7DC
MSLLRIDFGFPVALEPLTATPSTMSEQIVGYLRRAELEATAVEVGAGCGSVFEGERLVAVFSVSPMGGAA